MKADKFKNGSRVETKDGFFGVAVKSDRGWYTVKLENGDIKSYRGSWLQEASTECADEAPKSSGDGGSGSSGPAVRKINGAVVRVENYVKGAGDTPTGLATFDIGDAVACELRGMDTREVLEAYGKALLDLLRACEQTGADMTKALKLPTPEDLKERYLNREKPLNNGMVRMNVGNRMRAIRRMRREALGLESEE